METSSFPERLGRILNLYAAEFADETDDLALLVARHAAGDALEDRRTLPGHVTTSAIVLDVTEQQVLLVFHRSLGRWLQPGGHWEPAPSFAASAEREAREETGIRELRLHPLHGVGDCPVDIDSHAIPANPRKGEPAHVHFDLRYVFLADADAHLFPQEDEVSGATWRPLEDLAAIAPRAWRRLGGRVSGSRI